MSGREGAGWKARGTVMARGDGASGPASGASQRWWRWRRRRIRVRDSRGRPIGDRRGEGPKESGCVLLGRLGESLGYVELSTVDTTALNSSRE